MNDVIWMPATTLAQNVRDRALSAADVAEAMIARVQDVNPKLNALVHFEPDQVRADADALDAHQTAGRTLGPLHGVPYTIKDMTDVAGLPSTNGLKLLRANVAATDAIVVARMKRAGALFLGKTNVPEFGYYGGTDNHLFGPTHNPWKRGHTAGGSSGGGAAAVAAGMGPLAEGTDGAGSVRIPAAMCGVVGMKPTSGVVPPVLPFVDWVYHGPLSRTVADNALMMSVIAGHVPATPPSAPLPPDMDFSGSLPTEIRGLRVAWSTDLGLGVHVDPEVAEVAHETATALSALGARVVDASPRWVDASEAMWRGQWVPAYSGILATLDMDENPENYDEQLHLIRREGNDLDLKEWGTSLLRRVAMRTAWEEFMADYDLLLSPTLTTAAFPLDRFAPDWLSAGSLREQVLDWLLTYPFNMLGNPAISVPAGFTSDGRPVGLQIAGHHWQDVLVLRAARALEQERPWAQHKPDWLLASERS